MTTRIDRDLLRVIRQKLEEKRKAAAAGDDSISWMKTPRTYYYKTGKSMAFGEAIGLIDEALAELER